MSLPLPPSSCGGSIGRGSRRYGGPLYGWVRGSQGQDPASRGPEATLRSPFPASCEADPVHGTPLATPCAPCDPPRAQVLRLLALFCAVQGGMKDKQLQFFRREIMQTYGFESMLLLDNLERAGILRRQEGKNSFPTVKKGLAPYPALAPIPSPSPAPAGPLRLNAPPLSRSCLPTPAHALPRTHPGAQAADPEGGHGQTCARASPLPHLVVGFQPDAPAGAAPSQAVHPPSIPQPNPTAEAQSGLRRRNPTGKRKRATCQ